MTLPRLTKPTMGVLDVLLAADDDDPAWGLRICIEADLGSGTVYPILERLTDLGWLEAWAETAPHPGRPARRYYKLTSTGRRQALDALQARAARRRRPLVLGTLLGGPA
ncbi:helix-turn-helix transcriptional regulator [Kitasatospora sp. NPDC047058]|uniref:PadR family transcriptional regulator n=1 Tax=Kitasatospora sp. NPDC047058 TaxID=3155620 RepID=UPI0033C9C0E4